jgi:hypothetical protein
MFNTRQADLLNQDGFCARVGAAPSGVAAPEMSLGVLQSDEVSHRE